MKNGRENGHGEPTLNLVHPYRTDPISIAFMKLGGERPVLVAVVYFCVSFVVTYIIGLVTGQFSGKNGLDPMYSQVMDNVNLAIIAPIGAGLLCNLYRRIREAFDTVINDGIVLPSCREAYLKLAARADRAYNSRAVLVATFAISLAFNGYNYFMKPDSWLSINGGITGIYGRVFIVFNYFIIALISYKAAVTVWALQRILAMEIRIRPMHPDHASGLRPVGRLAVSVNSFMALVIVFVSVLILFDPFAKSNVFFVATFVALYAVTPALLFLSLSKANRKMRATKARAFTRLGLTSDYYYQRLSAGADNDIYDVENADEIVRVSELYQIVEKMPVWPFDTANLRRFITAITIPFLVFLVDQAVSTDSVINHLVMRFVG